MLLGAPSHAAVPTERARERIFDYFAKEVLSRMPHNELRALYTAAYLPG